MKVSIITRTTDRPQLQEAIESVKAQTYQNIEHVIVRGFDRFNAAAEGFRLATGDIMVFLDDDDIFAPDHVERAVMAFTDEIKWVNTGFAIEALYMGKKYRREKQGAEFDRKRVLFTHSCCFFFKRELLEQYDYLDKRYICPCEDAAFYMDIATDHPGLFTGTYTATYRLHGENTSGLSIGQGFDPGAAKKCTETVRKILNAKSQE